MKPWSEMSYVEQRAVLGLWQPPPSWFIQRWAEGVGAAFREIGQSIAMSFGLNVIDVVDKSGYGLAAGDD